MHCCLQYWLGMRRVFNQFGGWQLAGKILDKFLKLSLEKEKWFDAAYFYNKLSKFSLLQGKVVYAEKFLKHAQCIAANIEDAAKKLHIEAICFYGRGGIYKFKNKFDKAIIELHKSYDKRTNHC